jgi:hypothetical protein
LDSPINVSLLFSDDIRVKEGLENPYHSMGDHAQRCRSRRRIHPKFFPKELFEQFNRYISHGEYVRRDYL